jgi:hypothetical protein
VPPILGRWHVYRVGVLSGSSTAGNTATNYSPKFWIGPIPSSSKRLGNHTPHSNKHWTFTYSIESWVTVSKRYCHLNIGLCQIHVRNSSFILWSVLPIWRIFYLQHLVMCMTISNESWMQLKLHFHQILNSWVWLQVQLRVQDHLTSTLTYETRPISDLDILQMHRKIKR